MADREGLPLRRNPGPSAEEVEEYLRDHPDFFNERPEILRHLTPPGIDRGDGVIDFQGYILERVKGDLKRLQLDQKELIAISRNNLSSQSRIHAAVLAALSARTFEHLIEILTTDLAVHLDVDVVVLAFETDSRQNDGLCGLRLLPQGSIDGLIPPGKEIRLIGNSAGDPMLFSGAASLVRSQALMKLRIRREGPAGMLALGARSADRFNPGQGTELLGFLARVIEQAIRGWLDLPD